MPQMQIISWDSYPYVSGSAQQVHLFYFHKFKLQHSFCKLNFVFLKNVIGAGKAVSEVPSNDPTLPPAEQSKIFKFYQNIL